MCARTEGGSRRAEPDQEAAASPVNRHVVPSTEYRARAQAEAGAGTVGDRAAAGADRRGAAARAGGKGCTRVIVGCGA